jgi:ribonuclease D
MEEEQPQVPYELVVSQPQLESLAKRLDTAEEIAGDLEADSMFHYRERVCLLQLATREGTHVLDPLVLDSLAPLAPVFENPGVRKVFHGADYDIRCLYRDFRIAVNNLFDTQIAARYLGIQETGLANLLERYFGVHLEKKYQKKNWAQRPLPESMLSYAAGDAHYLLDLRALLRAELIAKGRLAWVEEECEILTRVRHAQKNEMPLFLRFKGAGRLDPRSLAVLEFLLSFREEMASRLDRPPFKVMGNIPILELAAQKPASLRALKKVQGLSPKQIGRFGREIVERVAQALSLPDSELPKYPHEKRKTAGPSVARRVAALKEWRQEAARGLELDPAALLSNAQIHSLALATPIPKEAGTLSGLKDVREWQVREFGPTLIHVLHGA